jgi:MiaB/RimO family radical SAM methylthiotransferase
MALGVLGCMAERLKTKLLESNKLVDLVVGPDAYRDLPRLLDVVNEGRGGAEDAMNVQLSLDETYADITPVRTTKNGVSSFLSIMRGCNNMCAFCIVPFTRGRERSRDISSILDEIRMLSDQGYKEVTLLGQNVNSYFDKSNQHVLNGTYTVGDGSGTYNSAKGFKNLYRLRDGYGPRFADLLYQVADINPEMRIRFTSPHPKDFPDQVLDVIAEKPNVCNSLHMPAQSGSTTVLDRMRRNYTREAYLDLIDHVRSRLPGVAISTDIITGFCNETEDEHQDTVSLMKQVGFDQAFMFAYSMRAKTHAYHKMEDNVPEEVKKRRLQEVVDTFRTTVEAKSKADLGTYQLVLIEGKSRRSKEDAVQWSGRNDGNKTVIVCENASDIVGVPASISEMERLGNSAPKVRIGPGDYVMVKVVETGPNTLKALPVARSSIMEFHKYILNQNERSDDETNQRSAMYG